MSRVIGLNPAYIDTAISCSATARAFVPGEAARKAPGSRRFATRWCARTAISPRFCGWTWTRRSIWMGGRSSCRSRGSCHERFKSLLDRNHRKAMEIEAFLLHQANLNLITRVAQTLRAEDSRDSSANLHKYGNTSSASLLIAASEWWQQVGGEDEGADRDGGVWGGAQLGRDIGGPGLKDSWSRPLQTDRAPMASLIAEDQAVLLSSGDRIAKLPFRSEVSI